MAYAKRARASLVCALLALGCGGEMSATAAPERIPALTDVTAEEWDRLTTKRFYFGHQSVGMNLVEGIAEVLARHPEIRLRVMEATDPSSMDAPGLYHSLVGRNGEPATKLEEFSEIAGGAGAFDAAMVKFCYVDITADTDPEALFASYRAAVDSLRALHPDLELVHVTLPLTSDRGTVFHLRTIVRGNTSLRELNQVRQRYNELMRETYGDSEPLFDLALLESLDANGQPVTVRYDGERVPVMASEWTYDGGHLNEAGRQRIAEAFLATLAGL